MRQTLKLHAEESFALAHEFVGIREEINDRAGTLRSLFQKISFDELLLMATTIEARITETAKAVAPLKVTVQATNDDEAYRFYLALAEYSEALENGARILSKKMHLLSERAKNRRRLSLRIFLGTTKSERASLETCQSTGDALTETFHRMKWEPRA